jgi:hypothetical protein
MGAGGVSSCIDRGPAAQAFICLTERATTDHKAQGVRHILPRWSNCVV